mgnify:FL=1
MTRGWIGVQISDLSPEIAKSLDLKSPHGALVQDVFKGDPADKAGLQSYDVVTKVNGKSVKNSREFLIAVGNLRPGSKVKMEYYRDGRKKDTRLTVAKRDNDSTIAKRGFGEGRSERKDRSKIEEKTGVVLAELNSQLRQRLGVPSTVKGLSLIHI